MRPLRVVQARRVATVVALTIVATAFRAPATTILAIRNSDIVVIVADSKASYKVESASPTTCKIIPLRGAFAALGGLVHDNGRKYDTRVLVTAAFEAPGTFSEHITRAQNKVRKAAQIELRRLKAEDLPTFKFTVKHHGNFADLVFATFENNIPRLSARRFHFDERTATVTMGKSINCPGKDCPAGTLIVKVGEVSAIERLLSQPANRHLDDEVLLRLFQEQINASPDNVGAPIEILRIDSSGPKWMANDLGCPL
jgi:hypothetical protein